MSPLQAYWEYRNSSLSADDSGSSSGGGGSSSELTSYTIKSGDTLSHIALEYLGNASLWTTIQKADGSNFTSQEANQLQIGQIIYIPKSLYVIICRGMALFNY